MKKMIFFILVIMILCLFPVFADEECYSLCKYGDKVEYYCGCDHDKNGILEIKPQSNEFLIDYMTCLMMKKEYGCTEPEDISLNFDKNNLCYGGEISLPKKNCEKDSTKILKIPSLIHKINILQGAFLQVPPGVGLFITLF